MDIINQFKKDRLKKILISLGMSLFFISGGILLSRLNQLNFVVITLNIIIVQLTATIVTFYGGWKIGEAFIAYLYFYTNTNRKITDNFKAICQHKPLFNKHPKLYDYLNSALNTKNKITMAEVDITLEYVKKNSDGAIYTL